MWEFYTDLTIIYIITPHFSLSIFNGARSPLRYGLIWGFDLYWGKRKNPIEGDLIFNHCIKYESEFIGYYSILKGSR